MYHVIYSVSLKFRAGVCGDLMKRSASSTSSTAAKKRKVSYPTFQQWKRDFDRNYRTVSWLECETQVEGGCRVVTQLKCSVCKKFRSRILSRRNFSDRWISGAESIRTSNIRDHAQSEQHVHAMSLFNEEIQRGKGVSVTAAAPIVVALNTLGDEERARLQKKFDITYYLSKEKLPFRKYPGICELEARHGVNIGNAYTTEKASKGFAHFIAEASRMKVVTQLKNCKFLSILLDGSTDSGNVDNELLMAVHFDREGADEKVSTKISYFRISRPLSTTAQGLFDLLQGALQRILGITAINAEECSALVGVGTDGAAVNVARAGLKGLVEKELPWVLWSWCMAHRLELAVRDALKSTVFDLVDDMLLRLYLIYENSPKKCRQLAEICSDLKQCLTIDPEEGGVRPVRASGSRWVAHKWNAMKRILSRYGAYTSHLIGLSEDVSVKSNDRAKLKGYYNKWVNAKYILGCAVFVDVLSPCVILSKVMQLDNLDILAALSSLLRSVKELDKLNSTPVAQWPTYASTINKCTTNEDGTTTYQAQRLKQYDEAKSYFATHCSSYCSKISDCIRSRLAWTDLELLRDVIFVLASQGWQKVMDENEDLGAISRLAEHFRVPLERANTEIDEILTEFECVLQYATKYISLSTLDYRAVWWRIFHSPDSVAWVNVLNLIELLFSLPVSNGVVERVFSQMNVIKGKRRSLLANDTLDDLLSISAANVPLCDFNPNEAIDLWWADKIRRPNQSARKQYKKRVKTAQAVGTSQSTSSTIVSLCSSESESDDDESVEIKGLLDCWDDWISPPQLDTESHVQSSSHDHDPEPIDLDD